MSENPTYSKWIFSLCGIAVFGLASYIYYHFPYLKEESILSEEDQNKISGLREELEGHNWILTPEIAIKLLALINKKTDEYINTRKPDMEKKRRDAFDKKEVYESICNEMLEYRNQIYIKVSDKILYEFGVSNDDLGKLLERLTPIDIEKKMYAEEKPDFENNEVPDRNNVKKAFMSYGKSCINQMKIFQNMVGKCDTDSKQQELVLYQLMILKFRIDDELYRNYSISENQLRFLLFEYNLADDPEIKKLMNDIAQYEENLNSSMD